MQNDARLFVFLFFFQSSFFLWTKLGLFLLFPFAFIFTSLITHICFSVIERPIPRRIWNFVLDPRELHLAPSGDSIFAANKQPTNCTYKNCRFK